MFEWSKVIAKLRDKGTGSKWQHGGPYYSRLEAQTGIDHQRFRRWYHGIVRRPNFEDGLRIILVYLERHGFDELMCELWRECGGSQELLADLAREIAVRKAGLHTMGNGMDAGSAEKDKTDWSGAISRDSKEVPSPTPPFEGKYPS